MPSPLQTLSRWNWRKWLTATSALLYCSYLLLSFFYLPGKLKQMAQTEGSALLGRELSVQNIRFNPFLLILEVDELALADPSGRPLMAWQQLIVDVELFKSLLWRELHLANVSVDHLQINLQRRADGFSTDDIVARLTAEPADAAADDTEAHALAVRIDAIALSNGNLRFDDLSGRKPATSAMHNLNFHLQHLYFATGEEHLNPFQLAAELPAGGALTLDGEYRVEPLQVNTALTLKDLQLAQFADFVALAVPVQVKDGVLALSAKLSLQQGGAAQNNALQLAVSEGSLHLEQLAIDDDLPEPMLRLDSAAADGIALQWPAQQLHIGSVKLRGAALNQSINADGSLRYESLLVKTVVDANLEKETQSKPWQLRIDQLALADSSLAITDHRPPGSAAHRLNAIELSVTHLQSDGDTPSPLTLKATYNDSGQAQAQGELIAAPFALKLGWQLEALPLASINPYLAQGSWLQLRSGTLSSSGELVLSTEPADLQLQLQASLNAVEAVDSQSGKPVVGWQALSVDQLSMTQSNRQITLGQLSLQQPTLTAEIDNNKVLNLTQLLKVESSAPEATASPTAPATSEKTGGEEQPWQWQTERISIEGGEVRFADRSISPSFRTELDALNLQLNDLRSSGNKPATLTTKVQIDRYAPLSLNAQIDPLSDGDFRLTGKLSGLDMSRLSPYSGTYIGYELDRGTLGLDIDYALKSRRLKGRNAIVARDLYLGDKVASEQAVKAPVALGLALLRDASGVIDLDVDVAGNLDDPSFSASGIVLKALLNIIAKAAASPFQLLGSLVSSSGDISQVSFAAGQTALNEAEIGKLQQLASALQQRPQLLVSINGNAGQSEDGPLLQTQNLLATIASERDIKVTELNIASLLEERANRRALERLSDEMSLPSLDDIEDALKASAPELDSDTREARAWQQLLEAATAAQPVAEEQLLALADERARAIKQALVTSGVDHTRVTLKKTRSKSLKGLNCKLGVAVAK